MKIIQNKDYIPEKSHTCYCEFCVQTRLMDIEFDKFFPKNNLQRRMKDVIKRIEKRERAHSSPTGSTG